jgi:hypothetical protein
MDNQDKILEFEKELMDAVIPFDKLPTEIRQSTFEYFTFRKELTKESDRGCALLAAAHLDFMLEKLLRKKLLGNKKHFETLFGFSGPLGTFSSRILLCYSIGLISADTLHDIQIVRKIRNEFGHSHSIIDFENQKIKEQCEKLRSNVHEIGASSRHRFLNVVSGISGQIEAKIFMCQKFDTEPEMDLSKRKENFDKMMEIIRKVIEPEK